MPDKPSSHAEYDRQRLLMRLEIVEGLITAHERWHEVSAAVEAADDRAAAFDALMGLLAIEPVAANHILDTTLARRSRRARAELAEERDDLLGQLDRS